MTAVLAAILFCAAVPGQTALTGYAANTLGSQGSQGNSSEGNEDAGGAEDAGGELDDEVNNIINENAAEGINGSTASKIKIIAASARVRSEASTSSSVVGSLASGDVMDVTGETTGSDGKVWYQITGEKDGKAINGYVREDTLEVTETAQPEAPAEVPEETPAEEPSDTAPSTNDYDVSYADDGMGNNDWYLNDNVKGTRYKISDLLGAAQTNETNIDTMEKQTGSLRLIIIILAVIIGLLVIVVTVMIFKLKAAYEDGYDEYAMRMTKTKTTKIWMTTTKTMRTWTTRMTKTTMFPDAAEEAAGEAGTIRRSRPGEAADIMKRMTTTKTTRKKRMRTTGTPVKKSMTNLPEEVPVLPEKAENPRIISREISLI